MEIHGSNQPKPIRPVPPSKSGIQAGQSGGASTPAQADVTQASAVLQALADSTSNVRNDLVQEIKLKVVAGEYLQSKAIYDTADAILNL